MVQSVAHTGVPSDRSKRLTSPSTNLLHLLQRLDKRKKGSTQGHGITETGCLLSRCQKTYKLSRTPTMFQIHQHRRAPEEDNKFSGQGWFSPVWMPQRIAKAHDYTFLAGTL